ncbi:hypothetical protein OV079_01150 [Nannocystis pusilla]|uniref:Uncharacterized protein n=1 Tax=Nannocystis pusilla TaxID=889268 RepID=A0A9X3IUT3_9BACT|nr:hypothetical protein [Nannocystis pusilla]MCY1004195.1 hypothetical protein [Nannocystis pusilla]
MQIRSPRPSVRGFSSGALLATLAVFFALYGTIVNIAEASRALAASKESLAKSTRMPVAALEARRAFSVHRRAPAPHDDASVRADLRAAALASSAPATGLADTARSAGVHLGAAR